MCYSEHYVKGTAQHVDSGIVVLNGVCYNEHYVEDTAQQVDCSIVA